MEDPKYKPMSVEDFNKFMNASYETQLQYAPQLIGMQKQAQSELYGNMAALQRQNAPANWMAATLDLFRQIYQELASNSAQCNR